MWLKAIPILILILQIVAKMIMEEETGGKGATKKAGVMQFVLSMIEKVLGFFSGNDEAKAMEQYADRFIEITVPLFHTLGIFEKKQMDIDTTPTGGEQ